MPIPIEEFKRRALIAAENIPTPAGWTVQRNEIGNVMILDQDGGYRGYVDFYRGETCLMEDET